MAIKLTGKNGFDQEWRQRVGPPKDPEILSTETHLYVCPFNYTNVVLGDWIEFGDKGMEFFADTGYLAITEEKPIIGVSVIGSGCVPRGYNICEWWGEGESIDDMQGALVKRLRVDNLNGTHPSIWLRLLMGTVAGRSISDMDEMKDAKDCVKKLSLGFYDGVYVGYYENTANFRVGPPFPNKVTIRSGCLLPEDPGTPIERYPGDYAIRVVQTTVLK